MIDAETWSARQARFVELAGRSRISAEEQAEHDRLYNQLFHKRERVLCEIQEALRRADTLRRIADVLGAMA